MTDEQIMSVLAEQVMGWGRWTSISTGETYLLSSKEPNGPPGCWMYDNPTWAIEEDLSKPVVALGGEDETFDPLNDDRAACTVLDALKDSGFRVSLVYGGVFTPNEWTCLFTKKSFAVRPDEPYANSSRRRAICIAALKALGAWTGE